MYGSDGEKLPRKGKSSLLDIFLASLVEIACDVRVTSAWIISSLSIVVRQLKEKLRLLSLVLGVFLLRLMLWIDVDHGDCPLLGSSNP